MNLHLHKPRLALLVLAAALVASCGGGSGIGGVFSGGRTITLEAFADVRMVETVPVRVKQVQAIPGDLTIARGGVAIFSALALDSQGRLLGGLRFEWRVRSQVAGTVSTSGVFTAGNIPGSYPDALEVIAIQEVDGQEFTAVGRVSVLVTTGFTDSVITSVVVFPSTSTGTSGDFVPMRAAALGNLGGLVQDLDLFWRVTNPHAGTINSSGGFTFGDKPGIYPNVIEVQARRLGGSGAPVVGRASVQVRSQAEASGQIRAFIGPTAAFGRPGGTTPLVLLTVDANGRPVPRKSTEWEMVEPTAGSVNKSGLFTFGDTPGAYPGAVRATAALGGSFDGDTASGLMDVIVQSPVVLGGRGEPGAALVFPQTLRLATTGTVRLSALIFDGAGVAIPLPDLTWEYDAALFAVDDRNRLTALAPEGVYVDALSLVVTDADGELMRITKSITVLGTLTRVEITPNRATLAAGDPVLFVAQAYDGANNRLSDVSFRWSIVENAPGSMTSGGLYIAEDDPGLHVGMVKLIATQRVPD
jgi:hypothetical protein